MSLASFDGIYTKTGGPCKFETEMKRMDHACRYHACDLDNESRGHAQYKYNNTGAYKFAKSICI
jgi:hypothetical protein